MIRLDKESKLLEPVAGYVRRKGYRWQQPELQFYQYRIDLYGFSRLEQQTIAIELKMEKWRRALEQAIIYQLCADLVYIAMPHAVVERLDKDLFREHGIGILSVRDSGRCQQIIPSQQSSVVRSDYRDDYVQLLTEDAPCRQ